MRKLDDGFSKNRDPAPERRLLGLKSSTADKSAYLIRPDMHNRKLLIAAFLVLASGCTAFGQRPPITVEIKTASTPVYEGKDFPVSTTLRNTGKGIQVLDIRSCSYGQQWAADNVSISTPGDTCALDRLVQVTLKPGKVYRRDLQFRAKLAAGVSESEIIAFRLGFRNGNSPNLPDSKSPNFWSNSVRVKVVRASTPTR